MNLRVPVIAMLLVVLIAPVFGQGTVGNRGLRLKCDGVSPGFTLFAPMSSDITYLVDANGKVVRTWRSAFLPSAWVYFLDNGHVLRGGSDRGSSPFNGGGQGGRFQEFDLDGNLVWDFRYNEPSLPHHDVAVLPNGNLLAIAWEGKTSAEARQAGRRASAIPANGIWPDMLIEFEPQTDNSARIVWEWHIWDHLIQNLDPMLDNYGDPAAHPERVDINRDTGGFAFLRDVFHTNAVAYNPELDQIILSVPTYNEIWVIDHSTTTQQAATRAGGRSGKGGDLLYRWGNPQAYNRGTESDQLLGFQHDARWVPQGRPGAGHIMVFSNRTPIPSGATTRVYEFVPPVDANGNYTLPPLAPFGPDAPLWTYSNPNLQTVNLSGAERLENGNTLISSGPQGRIFEVTPAGDVVWEYWNPFAGISGNNGNAFSLFRATRIPANHPALAGHDLRPLDPQPPASPFASSPTEPGAGQCPVPVIPAPTLISAQPSYGVQGSSLDLLLSGTYFLAPAITVGGEGIAVGAVRASSEESLTVTLTIAPDAALGPREVSLTTAGGTVTAAFNILPPQPTLTGISPGIGARGAGTALDVTFTGTNFVPGLRLDAGPNVTVTDLRITSSTEATARLIIGAATSLGILDVSVATPGGTSGSVPFTIADPFPDLSVRSTHTGNFGAGFEETFSVTISNGGAASSASTIVVTDRLPQGLLFVSAAGPDWSCSAEAAVVTCTTAAALAPNESTSYTLRVAVDAGSPASVNHSVSVALAGDLNLGNNSGSDPTTVVRASPVFVFTPAPLVPGQQAMVEVRMATPFPHDVTGEIALTFTSNAVIPVDDPAIQFATGGRTAPFTIRANETEARFASALQRGPLPFQSGTVAGTLAFLGTFRAGAIQSEFSATAGDALTIPLRALSIQSVRTSMDGGFAVSIQLFSTAREVTQLSLTFNTTPRVQLSCGATEGCSAAGNVLTLNVAPMFSRWFTGDVSYGGLAQLRLPFSIQGAVTGTVAVTLKNTKGESNSQSFALP
jgi:uncharacterized repeat protein (TIGR01451 family)